MCRVRSIYQTDIAQRSIIRPAPIDTNAEDRKSRGLKPAHKSFILWHMLVLVYHLSTSFCQCSQDDSSSNLVDLTHDFHNETIYYVTHPRFVLNSTFNGTLPGENYRHGVGIDTMSLDFFTTDDALTHVTLMEKDICGPKNNAEYDKLSLSGAIVNVMTKKLNSSSGATSQQNFVCIPDSASVSKSQECHKARSVLCSYLPYVAFVVMCVVLMKMRNNNST